MTDNTITLTVVQDRLDTLRLELMAMLEAGADIMSADFDMVADQWQEQYQLKLSLLQAA